MAIAEPGALPRARPPRRDRARLPGGRPAPARPRVVRARPRAASAGAPVGEIPHVQVPDWVRADDAPRPRRRRTTSACPGRAGSARVIGLVPGEIVTASLVGRARPSRTARGRRPGRDLAKIAVLERHLGTGRIGLGFVRGFGIQRGAFGATLSHDAHNVVVVGVDDGAMALRRRAAARARRRHRRRRRARGSRRAAPARRRAPLRPSARRGARREPRDQRGRARRSASPSRRRSRCSRSSRCR